MVQTALVDIVSHLFFGLKIDLQTDRAMLDPLVAAAEQALVWLIDSSVKAVVQVDPDDSVAQFIALGETYIDWASANPSQFRLLQDERVLNAKATPQLSRYIDSMVDLMIRTLERARDAGRLKPDENIPLMALSSHAFVIGLGRMIVEGRLHDHFYGDLNGKG